MEKLNLKFSDVKKVIKEFGGRIKHKTREDADWILITKVEGRTGFALHMAECPENNGIDGLFFNDCTEVKAIVKCNDKKFNKFQIIVAMGRDDTDADDVLSFGSGLPRDAFAFLVIKEPGKKNAQVFSILEEENGFKCHFSRIYHDDCYSQFLYFCKTLCYFIKPELKADGLQGPAVRLLSPTEGGGEHE